MLQHIVENIIFLPNEYYIQYIIIMVSVVVRTVPHTHTLFCFPLKGHSHGSKVSSMVINSEIKPLHGGA